MIDTKFLQCETLIFFIFSLRLFISKNSFFFSKNFLPFKNVTLLKLTVDHLKLLRNLVPQGTYAILVPPTSFFFKYLIKNHRQVYHFREYFKNRGIIFGPQTLTFVTYSTSSLIWLKKIFLNNQNDTSYFKIIFIFLLN